MTNHLPEEILRELHSATIQLGLERHMLLGGIPVGFVASLPVLNNRAAQLLVDLHELNRTKSLVDGSVPLLMWLANAASLTAIRNEGAVFERALSMLKQAASESAPPGREQALLTGNLPGRRTPRAPEQKLVAAIIDKRAARAHGDAEPRHEEPSPGAQATPRGPEENRPGEGAETEGLEIIYPSLIDVTPNKLWEHPRAAVLHNLMMAAYDSENAALHLTKEAGMLRGALVAGSGAGLLWNTILEEAAKQLKLGPLVLRALSDPGIAAYHNALRECLEPVVVRKPRIGGVSAT
jgi:hypothetical protein